MKVKDYYINELNSLRVDGAAFAKKNPGLSSYLAKEGQDPDVERMLEGFAFLTAKLRQKFDEELPEVSHNLMQLLWPNYIRPIPSYTIVQFETLKNTVKNEEIPKGMQLLSKATTEGVECKFQTSFNSTIMPIKLDAVESLSYGQKSSLELDFSMSALGNLCDVQFETLRLFLGGSKFMAKELYLYFEKYVQKIEIIIKDSDSKIIDTIEIPKNSISGVGFDPSETIVPYPRNVFDGYVMLQEFFCYEDKHLFMDIKNLSFIKKFSGDNLSQSKAFSLKIGFTKRLNSAQTPTIKDFFINCTPAINLFEADAVPIRKSHINDEYLISPSDLKKEQSEVFSILKVRGWISSKNIYQDYFNFESFGHLNRQGEYYSTRIKLSEDENRTNTYVRFASSGGVFDDLEHNNATVSVNIMCTNKDIPARLNLDDISVQDPLASSELGFKNITIPSVSYPPPIGGDFLWKVISNMSLNYLSLDNITTLKMILDTYDFYGANDVKRKEKTDIILSGLKSIKNKKTQMILDGLPIRGIETELFLNPRKFTGIGEAYHLCCVLNEFFALYCNVNTFHRLVVHIENGETFSWAPKMGYNAFA